MKLVRLAEVFDVTYGVNLELVNMEVTEGSDPFSINFVSRSDRNNGIAATVKRIVDIDPNPANTISVAGGGSVLASFVQPEPYYSGRDLYVLNPRRIMTENEMLFYCHCIKKNRYKYSFGRQANKTLKDILIPAQAPSWVHNLPKVKKVSPKAVHKVDIPINTKSWKRFKYSEIFEIQNGYYNKKPPINMAGDIPFIGASEFDNGITSYHSIEDISRFHKDGSEMDIDNMSERIFEGNCITVANNGNSVASAFYQSRSFTCSHDINILRLKDVEINPYIGLFLCALIRKERYRWSYGRKWRPIRMPLSDIKLPINSAGLPDWDFIEEYIKSLPYSAFI